MPQPSNYTPTTDFSQQEANNASGRSTVNTAALDAEFAAIETTLDQTLANLQLIQRDDGKLGDVTVEVRCLAPDVLNVMGGFNLTGLWTPATAYAVNDICSNGEYTYVCKTAHTSGGSFSATNWIRFGFTAGADAAQAAANAQASANAAAASQTASAASANTATNAASSASSSASSASGSASAASVSAGQASASATAAANSAASIDPSGFISLTGTQTLQNKTLDSTNNISGASGHLAGFRNKIINGGFSVNQRAYVSGAAVGSGLYGHDRWKMAASADTYTFSTTANKTTVTIPAGRVLRQVIEGLNLQTGTYTLSWEGTAQGKIGAGSYGASGVNGSITGGTDTTIEFGPGTVANVQLEFGSIATPFEHRHYGMELALCQRYYELISGQLSGCAFSNSNLMFSGAFKVQKRATPTVTAIVHGAWVGNGVNGSILSSSFTNGLTVDGYGMDSTSFTGSATQGSGYVLRGQTHAASIEL